MTQWSQLYNDSELPDEVAQNLPKNVDKPWMVRRGNWSRKGSKGKRWKGGGKGGKGRGKDYGKGKKGKSKGSNDRDTGARGSDDTWGSAHFH